MYSLWIFLNAIMDKIYWSTGQFVLGAVAGTVAVSVYAVAIQLQSMYLQFSVAISSVFLPKVTGMVTLKATDKELSDLFIRTGRIQNIIMSLILFGFVVFGQQFINLWAGENYSNAYYMTIAFFFSLYVPLIQNMGITILQARNQLQFRSVLYIVLAFIALLLEIFFAKIWGGIGCAIAVSLALVIGQGLVMNIYYQRVQRIDIIKFWKEIVKMDFPPAILTVLFICATKQIVCISDWLSLSVGVVIYGLLFAIAMILFSMNEYEKNLILKPIIRKISR